jgi:hypothetical protein
LARAGDELSQTKIGNSLRESGTKFGNDSLGTALGSLETSKRIAMRKKGKSNLFRIVRNDPEDSADHGGTGGECSVPSSARGGFLEPPAEDDEERSTFPDDLDPERSDWSEWSAEDYEPDEPWEMEGTFRRPNDF